MFSRGLYLEKIIHSMGNDLVKAITGVRRCGKSYLLNTLFFEMIFYTSWPLRWVPSPMPKK